MQEVESTLHFAEFGVVLLLFVIGLELQPSLLWRMRGQVFGVGGADAGPGDSALVCIGLIAAVIAGLILAGRFLLRPLFRVVASARSRELSSAWALLVVIGTALVMAQVGLSMALSPGSRAACRLAPSLPGWPL